MDDQNWPDAYTNLENFRDSTRHELLHSRDLYRDPDKWNLEGISLRLPSEKDGLTHLNARGKIARFEIALADACAESFLRRFKKLERIGGTTPWCADFNEIKRRAHFRNTLGFTNEQQALVWFTWDIMVPGRFTQERFEELSRNAATMFFNAQNSLMQYKQHENLANLLGDCAAKLSFEIKNGKTISTDGNKNPFESAHYRQTRTP